MRLKLLAVGVAAFALTGCYRATVVTGAQASPTVIDKPFQHSFVYGLVPPQEINTKDQCPNGLSKVVTEQSFINGLVGFLTWSLYTPIHVNITCGNR
jgi:hypothetical protein